MYTKVVYIKETYTAVKEAYTEREREMRVEWWCGRLIFWRDGKRYWRLSGCPIRASQSENDIRERVTRQEIAQMMIEPHSSC
jgi:hypothetical protein